MVTDFDDAEDVAEEVTTAVNMFQIGAFAEHVDNSSTVWSITDLVNFQQMTVPGKAYENQKVIATWDNQSVALWNVRTTQPVFRLDKHLLGNSSSGDNHIHAISWYENNFFTEHPTLVVIATPRRLRVWNIETKQFTRNIPFTSSPSTVVEVYSGEVPLIIASSITGISCYSLDSGKYLGDYEQSHNSIALISISETLIGVIDGTIVTWNIVNRTRQDVLQDNDNTISSLLIVDAHKQLFASASCIEHYVSIWALAGTKKLHTIRVKFGLLSFGVFLTHHKHYEYEVVTCHEMDERTVGVYMWNEYSCGHHMKSFKYEHGIGFKSSLIFATSPTDTLLLVENVDGTINVLNLNSNLNTLPQIKRSSVMKELKKDIDCSTQLKAKLEMMHGQMTPKSRPSTHITPNSSNTTRNSITMTRLSGNAVSNLQVVTEHPGTTAGNHAKSPIGVNEGTNKSPHNITTTIVSATDAETTYGWNHMQELSAHYGEAFWMLNGTFIMEELIRCKKYDFFLTFRHILTGEFCLKSNYLLEISYKLENKTMIVYLLNCWVEYLNKPIDNKLNHNTMHKKISFRLLANLKAMSKRYPIEVIKFLGALRLVRSYKAIFRKDSSITATVRTNSFLCRGSSLSTKEMMQLWADPVTPTTGNARRGPSFRKYASVRDFNNIANGSDLPSHKQPTSYFLPLADAGSITSLQLFLDLCHSAENIELFASEAGIVALTYAWDMYGRKFHMLTIYCYSVLLVTFTITTLFFHSWRENHKHNNALPLFAYAMEWLLLLVYGVNIQEIRFILFSYLYKIQYKHKRNLLTMLQSFIYCTVHDVWNLNEMLLLIFGMAGTILRIVYSKETVASRCCLSIGGICLWVKILPLLRPFMAAGKLISIIERVTYDIRYFIAILFLLLCGFTQAFWLLSYPLFNSQFGSVGDGLLTTFFAMFRVYDAINLPDRTGFAEDHLFLLLFVLFTLLMGTVMWNLLIALMSESYRKANANALIQWRYEQACTIAEQYWDMDFLLLKSDTCIHVLKYLEERIDDIGSDRSNVSLLHNNNSVTSSNKPMNSTGSGFSSKSASSKLNNASLNNNKEDSINTVIEALQKKQEHMELHMTARMDALDKKLGDMMELMRGISRATTGANSERTLGELIDIP